METIAAALISAVASVAVALISRPPRPRERAPAGPVRDARSPSPWVVAVACLAGGSLIAFQLFSSPDLLVTISLAAIPLLSVAFAYAWAPSGRAAASGVFALHAVNAGVMALSDVPGFMIAGASDLLLLLALFGVNAAIAAAATGWALRRGGRREERRHPASPTRDADGLGQELARLARLRKEGMLTEDEFSAAKRRLLAGE